MVWSTDAEDVIMLLDIQSPENSVLNDQLALNLVDTCLDSKPPIYKSVLCFAKSWKIDY